MPSTENYRIVPVEGGRFMILGPDGVPVRPNQDYPTKEVARDSLCESLSSERRGIVITSHPDGATVRVEVSAASRPIQPPGPADDASGFSFTMPAEFTAYLLRMAKEMDVAPIEVVRKSLGLMRIALDAKRDGNRVAILGPEMESEQEIEGI